MEWVNDSHEEEKNKVRYDTKYVKKMLTYYITVLVICTTVTTSTYNTNIETDSLDKATFNNTINFFKFFNPKLFFSLAFTMAVVVAIASLRLVMVWVHEILSCEINGWQTLHDGCVRHLSGNELQHAWLKVLLVSSWQTCKTIIFFLQKISTSCLCTACWKDCACRVGMRLYTPLQSDSCHIEE